MIKKRVRCFKRLVQDIKGQIIPVYFSMSDFYEGFDFYICKNNKELFFIDLEAIKYSNKRFEEIIDSKKCPCCGNELTNCLLEYPQNYFSNISSCWSNYDVVDHVFPPDDESLLLEMYDLFT